MRRGSRLARRSALVGYAELRRYRPLRRRGGLGSPGRVRRGPDELARAAVAERDGGRCVACGRAGSAQVHHRLPLARGGGNCVANLVSLCPGCHGWVHARPRQARPLGLLLPAGADPARVPVAYCGGLAFLTCDAQAVGAGAAVHAGPVTEAGLAAAVAAFASLAGAARRWAS